MPPIIQNRKTYIVSTRQLLEWKRIKKEASGKNTYAKIVGYDRGIMVVFNHNIIEKYDINGRLL
jgi:hypothetical protein